MTSNAPASSALLAQKLGAHTIAPAGYSPGPPWFDAVCGPEGSTRRKVSWFVTAFGVSTALRMACFSPYVLGTYLLKTLAPMERPSVQYSPILGVRIFDLLLGAAVWGYVEGNARRDGVFYGFLITALSRLSLYTFESAYFLLSFVATTFSPLEEKESLLPLSSRTQTVATLFLIDAFSLSSAFYFLPYFFPHSIKARPTASLQRRLEEHRELLINVALAVGLATFVGAFCGYTWERIGGMTFVKESVFELRLPSWLARDTLTAPEMMANPTIPVPTMRSELKPQSMSTHLLHSFLPALSSIPLVTILPSLSPLALSLLTFFLVLPSSLLLWDIMPISLGGALGAGFSIAARDGLMMAVVAWVLEELRMTVTKITEIVVVAEDEDGDVEIIEAVVEEEEDIGAVVEDQD